MTFMSIGVSGRSAGRVVETGLAEPGRGESPSSRVLAPDDPLVGAPVLGERRSGSSPGPLRVLVPAGPLPLAFAPPLGTAPPETEPPELAEFAPLPASGVRWIVAPIRGAGSRNAESCPQATDAPNPIAPTTAALATAFRHIQRTATGDSGQSGK
ncbi:MAG TPA: hypothetical protein VGE52_18150 [Pirellulales bacterium]